MNNNEIKDFFKNDRFASFIGAQIDSLSCNEVVCSLTIEKHHLNAGNKVQGGVIFTLADFAFAVACNYNDLSEDNDKITVSQSSNITFFTPSSGVKLTATSKCLQRGKKLSVFRMTVTDDLGINIAEMTGNAYTVSLAKK